MHRLLPQRGSQRPQEGYKTLVEGTPVYMHPSSALFGKPSEHVIYHTLVLTTKEYMHCTTASSRSGLSRRRRRSSRLRPRIGCRSGRRQSVSSLCITGLLAKTIGVCLHKDARAEVVVVVLGVDFEFLKDTSFGCGCAFFSLCVMSYSYISMYHFTFA